MKDAVYLREFRKKLNDLKKTTKKTNLTEIVIGQSGHLIIFPPRPHKSIGQKLK